jgi:hypothetical protein
MKNEKALFLWVLLVLVVGMIGCSSGGSSSGGSGATPPPATNPLVGTWKDAAGGPSLTFNANGTGSISDGHPITSWTLSASNVLHMTIPQDENFQLTWLNAAQTSMSLHNLSPSDETTIYNKS